MKNRLLLTSLGIAALVIVVFITLRVLIANKPQTPAVQMGAATIGDNTSKEKKDLFALAARYEAAGDLLNARSAYQKIMEGFQDPDSIEKAQDGVQKMNIDILFSTIPTDDSFSYEVQKGDTLSGIAKKFSTTQGLILKANNLTNPDVVPLGRRLKIHKDRFSIVVDKSQNILTLKSGDTIFKTYRVSTGINNCTPAGTFKIINKIIDPPWYTAGGVVPPDSPKNILGSRWLGLSAQGYGIHGTTDPQSIGSQVTSGCVRMKNSDVEELYFIIPEGTEVIIVD